MRNLNTSNPSSRYITVIILICLNFAPACGLVQRSTKANESTQLNTAQVETVNRHSLLEKSDTTAAQELHFEDASGSYQIEIWPKGSFRYHPAQGFEAEAEKVRITGQQNRQAGSIKQVTAATVQKQSDARSASLEQRQTASQQQSKQERNPAWGWALILLAVLLIFERFFTKSRYPFVP